MNPDYAFDKSVAGFFEEHGLNEISLNPWNLVWVAKNVFQTREDFEHQGNVDVLLDGVSRRPPTFPAFSIDIDLQERAIRALGYTFRYIVEANEVSVLLCGMWSHGTRIDALRWIIKRESEKEEK